MNVFPANFNQIFNGGQNNNGQQQMRKSRLRLTSARENTYPASDRLSRERGSQSKDIAVTT